MAVPAPGLRRQVVTNSKEVTTVKVKALVAMTTLAAFLAVPATALAGHFDGH